MLAAAAARAQTRISPRSRRLAPSARDHSKLLEAAGKLWQGGGHARTQMARKIQRRRSRDLERPPLRKILVLVSKLESTPDLPRHLGHSLVSVGVRHRTRHIGVYPDVAGM